MGSNLAVVMIDGGDITHQHGGMFAGEEYVYRKKITFTTCKQLLLDRCGISLIPDSFLYLLLLIIVLKLPKLPYLRLLTSSRDEIVEVRVGCHFLALPNRFFLLLSALSNVDRLSYQSRSNS